MSGIGRVGSGGGYIPDTDVHATPGTMPASTPAATSGTTARTSTTSAGSTAASAAPADIWATIAKGAAGKPTPTGVNLDATGARRPVALGQNARFTATAGRDATTPTAVGAGLFNAANLIDDCKDNLFDTIKMPADTRQRYLTNLKSDLASVAAGKTPPAGLNAQQALQMRSSASTVLLELMTAKQTPDAQKREAFTAYADMVAKETNPLLKDGMALHLDRLKGTLPADLQAKVGGMKEIIAPSKPPYDAWFKNGNNKVSVDWSAGSESLQDDITNLKKAGFKVKTEGSWNSPTVLEKTFTANGKKTTFAINMRNFSSDMFKNMGDPNANMVIYTGHSNWGNNVRGSLGNLPPAATATGGKDKLVLTDLCVGKGEIQQFRDKFPDAQMITTFTSSYFVESGEGAEPDSEGIHAILNTFEGIANRRGYDQIAEAVRKDNPWGEDHASEGIDNNYIFPNDLANRRKVLDADHDGQADVFDRVIDFSTYNVAEDSARDFTAIDNARPAEKLVGTKNHFAAMTVNRLTIYSEIFGNVNSNSKVVPGGYFEPKAGEKDLFRFQKQKLDGKDALVMTMSSKYAHMSEESLRMAACFEYNNFMAKERGWKLDKADTMISGMILASHSLDTDSGFRDDQVWQAFTKAYNLPTIPRSEVERVKEINHEFYSGSYDSIKELKKTLSPATLAALGSANAGKVTGNR